MNLSQTLLGLDDLLGVVQDLRAQRRGRGVVLGLTWRSGGRGIVIIGTSASARVAAASVAAAGASDGQRGCGRFCEQGWSTVAQEFF